MAEPQSAGDEQLFTQLDANGDGSIAADEVPAEQARLYARLVRNADADGDKSLSRDEFLAGLVPSRPEKKIEVKQPDSYPQADAVRYLLLTMDTSRNSWIEPDEVPDDMQEVYDVLAERIDANKNGTMDRYELSRGARELGRVAARFVARERIDVAKELRKFDKSQGQVAKRFDENREPLLGNLGDPRQARLVFKQFDSNADGKLVLAELPDPVQPQFQRLMRLADRDRDGSLSEREFLVTADRIGRAMRGSSAKAASSEEAMAKRAARRNAKVSHPTETPSDEMSAESMPAEE